MLASSMDKNRLKYTHSAYVETIRQLGRDETKIL
ncbi:MAG: DUF4393 domain-containing protein [Oleispira sp.]|nr:DUF4393 domain-containing protein [Oleispira sp.]MBL4880944.1 DUF4393 domain-containing protein [Oleispira sp.]